MIIAIVSDVALVSVIVFSILLIILHFLKPENDPSWRMISEYEIGRWGWLMRIAFFFWSLSCFALVVGLFQRVSIIGEVLLTIVAIGPLGAAFFATDPITTSSESQSTTSKLHSLFGTIFIFGLPIAATVVDWNLGTALAWASFVVWLGLVVMGSVLFVGVRKAPLGPQTHIGWPNRFMVLTYVVWIIVIAVAIR
jgi:Protein of unknown function (DUF998)